MVQEQLLDLIKHTTNNFLCPHGIIKTVDHRELYNSELIVVKLDKLSICLF